MAAETESLLNQTDANSIGPPERWQEAANQGDPEAQYQLGKAYLAQSNLSRGRRWLMRAAENGSGRAATDLGLMHVFGEGVPVSPPDGVHWLRRGAELGAGQAMAWLAQFSFTGHGMTADKDASRAWLLKAARAGNAMALRQLGFVYARLDPVAVWQPRAFACLAQAAAQGDPWAAHACGVRLLEGNGVTVDEQAGQAWLAQAASADVYLSKQRLGDASGVPGEPPGMENDAPLADFDWPAPREARLERLSEQPPVYRISGLVEREMCEYLINRGYPHLEPARTVNPQTGQPFKSQIRTNSNVGFAGTLLDIPIHLVEWDMMHLAQADVRRAERLALLRYGPGQEYKPHFDYINPHAKDLVEEYRERGQRVKTIFTYLNEVKAGGETDFPRLGLKLKPELGGGVMFHNTTPEGKPHEGTLHAGCPVIEGEKWLATLWIRERPVTYR